MASFDVWQGIDCLAFHENAILLDVKLRSQGIPIRSAIYSDDHVESQDCLTPQLVRNVLDDFALVVSGRGGKDNVSAVCMEHYEALRIITLRVSSNDGIQEQKLGDLEGVLQLITKIHDSGIEPTCEEVLTVILQQCAVTFLKHVIKFSNELKQARCPPDTHLRFPGFSIQDGTNESPTDIGHLGPYAKENHQGYMQLSSERLCTLRRLCFDLTASGNQQDVVKMRLLAKAAYQVRRSSSFDRFLRHNLLASQKPMAVQSMAQNLKERLGKISRFWRAAINLTAFGLVTLTQRIAVNVSCLPASTQTVHELRKRTPAQLRGRGGRHFQSCSDVQLQGKLEQWPRYRVHCELQLVAFYEENPHLRLQSRYIGCNKLACYLCYNFITNHGQFQVKGCHQGLYSLWTVPRTISFEKHDKALQFQRALRQLALTLERRVDTIRKAPKLQWKYRTNHESTANLSRLSLPLPTTATGPPTITKTTAEASDAGNLRQSSQPENFRNIGNLSRHDPDGGEPNQLAQNSTTGTKADDSVAQSPRNNMFDHRLIPAASTTRARRSPVDCSAKYSYEHYSDAERDMSEQPTSQLDAILPIPSHSSKSVSNVSAAAVTLTIPPVGKDEADRDDASIVSCCQDKEPARASRDIGQDCPGPQSDLTSSVLQTSIWKESKSSPFHDGGGAEEIRPPERRHRQVRLSTDFYYEQYRRSAHIIGGHESRTCDMPFEFGMIEGRPMGQFSMPNSNGMCRTFDFHDMELFLEIEHPISAQMIIIQCSRPENWKSQLVVEVDKIEPGGTLEFDTGKDLGNPGKMYLTMRDSKGIDQWWECRWKVRKAEK